MARTQKRLRARKHSGKRQGDNREMDARHARRHKGQMRGYPEPVPTQYRPGRDMSSAEEMY